MKLNFIHVCETAFISQSGNLNIIEIFEGIFASKFPAIHPKLTVVASVEGVKGRHEFEIKILGSAANKIASVRGGFVLNDTKSKFGIITAFNGIKFEKEDIYKVQIFVDSKNLGETPFEVKQIGNVA